MASKLTSQHPDWFLFLSTVLSLTVHGRKPLPLLTLWASWLSFPLAALLPLHTLESNVCSGRRESASGNGDFVESIRQGSLRAPTTLDNISGGMSVIVVFSGGRDACC